MSDKVTYTAGMTLALNSITGLATLQFKILNTVLYLWIMMVVGCCLTFLSITSLEVDN